MAEPNPVQEEWPDFVTKLRDQVSDTLGGGMVAVTGFDADRLGGAVAIMGVRENLSLRVARDRGVDVVLVGDVRGNLYPFEDLAVVLGWLDINELLTRARADVGEPPCGPLFGLDDALGRIRQNREALNRMFSPGQAGRTQLRLRKVGAQFDGASGLLEREP